jgi:hypothetical protein
VYHRDPTRALLVDGKPWGGRRMTKPISFLIAIVLLPSCRKSGKDWVVLPEKDALELKHPCWRPFPEGLSGYWEPGMKSIRRSVVCGARSQVKCQTVRQTECPI